jgi:pimeloyl-ACP methyl ester carboxylesterase
MRKPFFACLLIMGVGCATTAPRYDVLHPPLAPAVCPTAVVFVANGSGDFRSVTANLTEVVAEQRVPLQIETVHWSHGYGRYITDHLDHANQVAEGQCLACQVAEYRRAYPGRKVYLMGHSAGCAVVLAAAEQLPPNSVDRVILLAPAVCAGYDLRPALQASRGIDVFYSSEDRWVLGLAMWIVGTADRGCRTAAGRHGFTPVLEWPGDDELYAKLRQHPWHAALQWSGHDGGHYGNNQTGFLRAYVLPLLVCD